MTRRTLVLDANLLVLFVAGLTDRRLIGQHKRLRAYVDEDFVQLHRILAYSARVMVTPHVLAETSNLLGQIEAPSRQRLLVTLSRVCGELIEVFVAASDAARDSIFPQLGLTDTALLMLPLDGHALLTADHDLHVAAIRRGHDSRNFNHTRSGWLRT